jgi:hypothetical protein
MDKFIIDGNNQRIIRVKDDMPSNVDFNEAYLKYAIPFSDIDGLIDALKRNGSIKPEIREGGPKPTATTTITAVYDKPEAIINTQANIIDKQLNIIQSFLVK